MADEPGSNEPKPETKPATAEKSHPPWVALTTALIAAIGSLTAAWITYISKEGELKITAEEKRGALELAAQARQYEALDRATDPDRSPEARKLVLRFLGKVPKDERLRSWANGELVDVEARIAELEKAYSEAAAEADQVRAALQIAQVEGERLREEAAAAAKNASDEVAKTRQENVWLVGELEAKLRDAMRKQASNAAKLNAPSDKSAVTLSAESGWYEPSEALRSNLIDAVKRADNIERRAFRTGDDSKLSEGSTVNGKYMASLRKAIAEQKKQRIYAASELVNWELQSISITGDQRRAKLEVVESWETSIYSRDTDRCMGHQHVHPVPQTIYLIADGSTWKIDDIQHHDYKPPEFVACHANPSVSEKLSHLPNRVSGESAARAENGDHPSVSEKLSHLPSRVSGESAARAENGDHRETTAF